MDETPEVKYMSDKSTGSYYTPKVLVRHMIQSIRGRVCFDSVLEPSCGDGRFLDELIEYSQRILAIELDPKKVKILKYLNNGNMTIECADFIYYSLCHNEQYSLIIGNPPYISKKSVDENQRKLSTELLKLFKQPESIFQNLWVSFILGSLKLLSDNGTIFFVLPFEFLQVQYAEKLRVFLEEKFNTIEITTFQEQVFSDIEQDVCLVLMCNEKNAKPFIKYTTLKSIQNPEVVFQSVIMRNKPLKKWSNCILNDDETEFLKSMAKKYPQIKKFGEISPGIVTGANSFFILDRNAVNRLAAENFVINIISKGKYFLISMQRELDNIIIYAENNGRPIETDIRPRIFEPLFSTYSDGTGLGLTIIQDTLFSYGSEIELCSNYPETRFRIIVPQKNIPQEV